MSEPHDAGSQESKQGMIIVGLIGLNALCIAVLAGASLFLPRNHGATPVATSESTTASSAAAAAKEEPKAGETTPASDTKAAPSAAATAAPAAAADSSSGGQHAVVATPSAKVRAVLHTKPDAKGPTAAMLPTGTKLEVTNKQQNGKQTWYQVKTVDFQPASTGWLHSAVVKME